MPFSTSNYRWDNFASGRRKLFKKFIAYRKRKTEDTKKRCLETARVCPGENPYEVGHRVLLNAEAIVRFSVKGEFRYKYALTEAELEAVIQEGDSDSASEIGAAEEELEAVNQEGESDSASEIGGAAFYWFSTTQISAAGHHKYGKYAYEAILPFFSPVHTPLGLYYFFDGEVSVGTEFLSTLTPEVQKCLDIVRQSEDLYCIAIQGTGSVDFDELHRELRKRGVVGYMGYTGRPDFDMFAAGQMLEFVARLGLVKAFTVKMGKLQKDSCAFLPNHMLQEMGFSIVDNKVACSRCGKMILERMAVLKKGLCIACSQSEK